MRRAKFRVRRVNGLDPEVVLLLSGLHDATFGDDAYLPDVETGWWWVVYTGDKPVGFCSLAKSTKTPGYGYLQRVGVLPKYRGHGLHRRLIRLRERKARALGYKGLVSDTCEALHSANNLIAEGFRLFEPHTPWALKCSTYWRKDF